MQRKKILLITRFFPPEGGAASERMRSFAKYLSDEYEVMVLTTMPSYPAFRIAKEYRTKLYEQEKGENGHIRIFRFFTFQLGGSFIARLFSEVSFVVFGAVVSLLLPKPHKVIVSSPPFFLGFLGLFWKYIRRVQYIFDVRDLYPDSIIDIGFLKNKFAINRLKSLEKFFYKKAEHVVTVSSLCKKRIASRAATDCSLVYNGIDIDAFDEYQNDTAADSEIGAYFKKDQRNIVYIGNIGRLFNFDVIFDAVKKVSSMHLLMVGQGWAEDHLKERCKKEGIGNVTFVSSLQWKYVPRLLAKADAGIVAVDDNPITQTGLPNKLFEYFAASLPVYAHLYGEARDVFGEYVMHFDTADELVALLEKELPQKNAQARAFVEKTFDRKKTIDQLKKILS